MDISVSHIIGGAVMVIPIIIIVNYLLLRLIDINDSRSQCQVNHDEE